MTYSADLNGLRRKKLDSDVLMHPNITARTARNIDQWGVFLYPNIYTDLPEGRYDAPKKQLNSFKNHRNSCHFSDCGIHLVQFSQQF